jgi:NAD(P)-dependent dehydrogenase (short-subunit alcohol dehydrogenase family)
MEIHHIPENYKPAADSFAGRQILVTGAGDGIGAAVARALAAHGATVILSGRTVPKLEAVYDEIEQAGGPQPAILPLDLTSCEEAEYATFADAIAENFPHLDGLLLNAGVLGERRPLENATWKAWQEVMQVNVNSQFLLCKHLLPLLRIAPAASIVLTTSGVGRKGRAYWGAYAVSKFAVEGMTQVLADELENTSSVRVNAINPGATNTAMRRAAYPGEVPTDNPSPAEITGAYLYLLGADSAPATGCSFNAQ